MFGVGEVLGAEPAAHVGGHEAHVAGLDTERTGHMVAVVVDVLARDMERVAAGRRIEGADTAARFHRIHDDAMVVELQGDDVRGPAERRVGAGGIAGAPVETDVSRHLLRQDGGAGCAGRLGRRHGGKRLVVDRNEFRRIECLGVRFRHDQRHRFAGKAHFVGGEQRLGRESERLTGLEVGLDIGAQGLQPVGLGIRRRQYGEHAGRLCRRGRVDRRDHGVGMRGAQDDGMRQARDGQVVEIGATAGDEACVLTPLGGIADFRHGHVRKVSAFFACRISSHRSRACSPQ